MTSHRVFMFKGDCLLVVLCLLPCVTSVVRHLHRRGTRGVLGAQVGRLLEESFQGSGTCLGQGCLPTTSSSPVHAKSEPSGH